jgi:hypothetical protein
MAPGATLQRFLDRQLQIANQQLRHRSIPDQADITLAIV